MAKQMNNLQSLVETHKAQIERGQKTQKDVNALQAERFNTIWDDSPCHPIMLRTMKYHLKTMYNETMVHKLSLNNLRDACSLIYKRWLALERSATPRSENGQSSNSNNDSSFVCEICAEPKSGSESFSIKGCSHSYCSRCMVRYVASKLQDNITRIDCPVSGCNGSLEPEYCHSILLPEVFDRWGTTLSEALILGTEKFYCAYKNCSVMLIDDGKEVIMNSECPSCYRMFCAQCKVPWHEGIECVEFQKLNKDEREKEDIMLKNLAQNKQWKRCPTCKYYVERSSSCLFIQCRGLRAIGNGCKKLKDLTLSDCYFLSDKGLEAIATGCKQLTHLTVNGCHNIGTLGLEFIEKSSLC
ncbi:E3 ubiquitin-protein ligase RSL1-like [Humulus lupulus]|uniref:E3 ubiquitin-protein ligase RSL1-like n=1 Tax=Humulus lupulus TaxID=3486 RepID=UPI002B414CE1|nr:E3 ubiquitin-protein ligase RSL1-like [Humulus lupulus]